jgi:hypothetical protein
MYFSQGTFSYITSSCKDNLYLHSRMSWVTVLQ